MTLPIRVTGQAVNGSSSSSNTMVMTALPVAPTSGNKVIVAVLGAVGSAAPSNTPSMTGVSNWVLVASSNTSSTSEIWMGDVGASAGTICTVTSGTAHMFRGVIVEYQNLVSAGATGSGSNDTSNTFVLSSPSITPSASVDALFIAIGFVSGGAISTPTGGFTALPTNNTAFAYAELIVNGTTGTYATSWTKTVANNTDERVIAVVYGAAGGAVSLVLPESLGLNSLGGLH